MWAYVESEKVAAMESWPEACISLDPCPPVELGEASRAINVQLRVMRVDALQMGQEEGKDRRAILVQPGLGGEQVESRLSIG